MILGLAGAARSGKDTAAAALAAHGFTRVAFADKLRAVAYGTNPYVLDQDNGVWSLRQLVDLSGWERAKQIPSVREFLQRLGTEGVRTHLGEGTWINAALNGLDPDGRYVVTDVRFPSEAQAIKERGGSVVQIQRPGVSAINGHASEHALSDWRFDRVVVNNSTPEVLAERILAHLQQPSEIPVEWLGAR